MTASKTKRFPKSRIATNDVCAVGLKKHHIASLLEIDVTDSREKIRIHKRNKEQISFTAWLIKVISTTIKEHEEIASYLKGKRKLVIFNDINSLCILNNIDLKVINIPVENNLVDILYYC